MRRLHLGDQTAFSEIYNQFYTRLYYYAYGLIHNREEAEDIVLNKLLSIWQRRHAFKSRADMKAYVYVAVRNACYDYLAYMKVHRTTEFRPEEMADQKYELFREELISLVMEEIEKLTPRERAVMHMTLEEIPEKEIAEQLGISVKRVYNLRYEAIQKLKFRLPGFVWMAMPVLEKLLRTCLLESSSHPLDYF